MDFTERYKRWAWVQSITILTFGGVVPLAWRDLASISAIVVALWGVVSFPVLYMLGVGERSVRGTRPSIPLARVPARLGDLPDLLTSLRGVGGIAFLAFVAIPELIPSSGSWIVVGAAAAIELTDFFDGRLARKRETRPFGAIWDMENDAYFTFALSYAAWRTLALPWFVLVIGWMRYLYFVAVRTTGESARYPRHYVLFAKSVAAGLVIVLIAVFSPILSSRFKLFLVVVALVFQTVSFGWECAIQRRLPIAHDNGSSNG